MRPPAPLDAAPAAVEQRRWYRFGIGVRDEHSVDGEITWQWSRISPPILAVFVVLYAIVAELSGQLSTAQGISPWYPPAGLSLAIVLVFGIRAAPVVFLADALQLLLRGEGGSLLDVAVQALAQAVFWGSTGYVLRPLLQAEPALSRLRDVAWFALIGVVLGSLGAALAGVTVIFLLQGTGWDQFVETARVYFIGDAIGVLSITPAALVLAAVPRRRRQFREAHREAVGLGLEYWAIWIATLAVPAASICLWNGDLLPLAPLPVAWVALRLGMPTASLGLLVWSFSAAAAFALGGSGIGLWEISASMIVGGMLAIAAGAVVTERERGRARLAYLALHDELTGLPNRRGFTESVADALSRAERSDVAVLLVRLNGLPTPDGSKTIDDVLLRAAHRLRRLTGPDSTIARIGSRRFVVLVDGPDARRVDAVAARVVEGLERPAEVDGREYLLGPVVGTARGAQGLNADQVLGRAVRAAGVAHLGTRHAAAYDEAMQRKAGEEEEMGHDLREALARDGLHVVFQPIVSIATGLPTGAEALCRWDHPTRGAVGPNEFIPVAEAVGLILQIGRWVLRESCRRAASWPIPGDAPLIVHVNVSPVQLRDEALIGEVQSVLADTGLDPRRLCLELTESGLFEDLDLAASRVLALNKLGVQVVLDDFGTGYSSLSWLQQLPVTALKVDRSFVNGVDASSVDFAIVSATLSLAQTMDLETVAEGVETEEQLAILRDLGCTSAQGYLMCRPVPDDEFQRWLSGHVPA